MSYQLIHISYSCMYLSLPPTPALPCVCSLSRAPSLSLPLSLVFTPRHILPLVIPDIIPCSKAPNFSFIPHIYWWRLCMTYWDVKFICVSALISSPLHFIISTILLSPPWYPFSLNSDIAPVSGASFHEHIHYLKS